MSASDLDPIKTYRNTYTNEATKTAAAKWGIFYDTHHNAWLKDDDIIVYVGSNNRAPQYPVGPYVQERLCHAVGVHDFKMFLLGPSTSPQLRTSSSTPKEAVMPDVRPTPEGYVPMVNRPKFPKPERENLARLLEQLVIRADKPVTAHEVFEEAVRYAPYVDLAHVKNGLQNLVIGKNIPGGAEKAAIHTVGYTENPEYGKVYRAPMTTRTYAAKLPYRVDEEDIIHLPDWRPRPFKARSKGRTNKQRPMTLADQQRKAAERKAKAAAREARKAAEPQIPINEYLHPNGTFQAVARNFENPDVLYLRDDQGNLWEARRSSGLSG